MNNQDKFPKERYSKCMAESKAARMNKRKHKVNLNPTCEVGGVKHCVSITVNGVVKRFVDREGCAVLGAIRVLRPDLPKVDLFDQEVKELCEFLDSKFRALVNPMLIEPLPTNISVFGPNTEWQIEHLVAHIYRCAKPELDWCSPHGIYSSAMNTVVAEYGNL